MEWYWALAVLLGLVLGLMFLRVPVAFAFFGANVVGAILFFGGVDGITQVVRNAESALTRFSLAPIALFILMGEILFQSGLARKAIAAFEVLIARVPGRLAIVAVSGGTVFSTLSGSSMANTTMLATTLMPEMRKRGYHSSMVMGPILATGGIAMLIPPSGMAILLGSLSGISIGAVLLAGAIPGIIMAVVHLSYVMIRCRINPELAPAYETPQLTAWQRIRPVLVYVLPLMSLFVVVVGSILGGFATPTEAAALGAVGAMIAAAAYRCLSWQALRRAMLETGAIAAMILFIIAASLTFSQLLSFSGAARGFLEMITAFEPTEMQLIFGMLAVMLVLGCFMDPLSILMITLPFFMPLARQAGFDLVWFGVLMLLALEISQTTPPFGILLFVMKGVAPAGTTMREIYAAVAPFILLEIAILVVLIMYPELITWLPEMMARR